jgi:hypothetical protein
MASRLIKFVDGSTILFTKFPNAVRVQPQLSNGFQIAIFRTDDDKEVEINLLHVIYVEISR